MDITWHGHGTFELISERGTDIVIDPWTQGAGEYPPNPSNDLSSDDLSPDIIALTHGDAFDHAGEAHLYDAPILGQPKIVRRLSQKGHEDVHFMDIGGEFEFDGNTFLMTHAFHSLGTAHAEFDLVEFGGLAAGYVIDDGETRYYHAGDTGLFGDMKTVIGDVYDPDIAALPIGGLVTMEPKHAAVAADWLGVDAVIPYHYNTGGNFQQDPNVFVDLVNDRCEADVHVLDPGESVNTVR